MRAGARAQGLVVTSLALACTFSATGGGQSGGLGDAATDTGGHEATTGPSSLDGGSTVVDGEDVASQSTTAPPPGDTTASPTSTGEPDPDGSSGSAGADTGPAACDGFFWSADFSVDPTTLDVNADGVDDWAMRDGGSFPVAELSGGRWVADSSRPLDTRPRSDFASRMIVDLRMRATASGGNGAVFWVNMDYDVTYSPIWVAVALESGDQVLRLQAKSDNSTTELLHTVPALGDGLVDISLDIDTELAEVALWVDGAYEGSFSYPSFPIGGNDDRFATLFAWDTTAEFDAVTITQCP